MALAGFNTAKGPQAFRLLAGELPLCAGDPCLCLHFDCGKGELCCAVLLSCNRNANSISSVFEIQFVWWGNLTACLDHELSHTHHTSRVLLIQRGIMIICVLGIMIICVLGIMIICVLGIMIICVLGVAGRVSKGSAAESLVAGLGCTHPDSNRRWVAVWHHVCSHDSPERLMSLNVTALACTLHADQYPAAHLLQWPPHDASARSCSAGSWSGWLQTVMLLMMALELK
jgi:hypothetical protein